MNCWDFPENEETDSFSGGGLSGGESTGMDGVWGDSIETGVFGGDSCGGEEGNTEKGEFRNEGSLAGCWENLFLRCQENCPLGFPGKLRKRLTGWRKMLISDWRDSSTSSSHWTSSTKNLSHWLVISLPL